MRRLRLGPLVFGLLLAVTLLGPTESRGGPEADAPVPGRYELHYAATYSCTYPNFVDSVVASGMIPFHATGGDGPVEGKGTFRHQGTNYAFAGPLILKGRVAGGVLHFTFPAGYSGGQLVYNRTESLSMRLENGARVDPPVIGGHGVVCTGSCSFTLKGPSKLLSLEVIEGATKNHVRPPRTWAAVKDPKGYVVVEAKTKPANEGTWAKIQWGGDASQPVPGHANRRRISKVQSRRTVVSATLEKDTKRVDLWILWATVEILHKDKAPSGAPTFTDFFDKTEVLGPRTYEDGAMGCGKIVAVATITPAGVHQVVPTGWKFRRKKQGVRHRNHSVNDVWLKAEEDGSQPKMLQLTPDANDKVYDCDAPTIGGSKGADTNRAAINFFQWLEWNGKRCSDDALWHFGATWDFLKDPKVTSMDVGPGHTKLPSGHAWKPWDGGYGGADGAK